MSGDLKSEMQSIREGGLMRALRTVTTAQGPVIEIEGRKVLNFCSNDYLSLAADPRVVKAVQVAASRWGAGAGSSRLIAGNLAVFEKLERRIAGLKGTEAALMFTSGYHANLGVIPVLAGEGDVIFSDRLNHASVIDGCRLARASVRVYEHNDADHLDWLLREEKDARRKLVVTESLFSMEGHTAALGEIVEAARRHGAMVMVDDAHATGVIGASGAGGLEPFQMSGREVDLVMGTLGKALASSGAFVCASREVIELITNRARTFIFTTGPSPAAAAAAIEALRIMDEEPWRRRRALCHASRVREALVGAGLDTPSLDPSPIVPVVLGEPDRAMQACEAMLEAGVFVQGIRPPTVPEGTSRLRITTCAGHTEEQVDRLINELMEALGK